jgi:hypothetical protein
MIWRGLWFLVRYMTLGAAYLVCWLLLPFSMTRRLWLPVKCCELGLHLVPPENRTCERCGGTEYL